MNDLELAEEVEWLHKFINCVPFGADAPQADIDRAHSIIAALRRVDEREGFYEKLWKDFVSLQRGDAQGILAKVEAYYRERPPSGEMVMMPRELPAIAQKMAEAVRWIIRDAVHKAPEQIGDIAERWIMRLREVEEFANAVLSAAEAEGRKS